MQHATMIDAYVAGGPQLRNAIAGLTTVELNAYPVPGTWSIQQVCAHLLHSEIFAVGRMCQIIAENVPLLMNWDENTFVARLRYDTLPIDDVTTCFETLRKTMGATLRQQRDEDFSRHGIHSKNGRVTLEEVVVKYTEHLHHHLAYIATKRKLLGQTGDGRRETGERT